MSTFEYLAVLFSVVVGLAVTHTLAAILRIVRYRKSIRIYWPTFLWTAVVLQWTVLFWWFSGLDLVQLQQWRFTTLLFVLTYGSALFFLLGLLHPEDIGSGFDMRSHFEENQSWFFGMFLALGLLDAVDTSYKLANDFSTLGGPLLVEYVVFMSIWIVGAAAALRVRRDWYLVTFAVIHLLLTFHMATRTVTMGPSLGG